MMPDEEMQVANSNTLEDQHSLPLSSEAMKAELEAFYKTQKKSTAGTYAILGSIVVAMMLLIVLVVVFTKSGVGSKDF
eukprot:CAMPEP_0118688768 /NCGR_PEP_ID=MMETSP0800-20121206/9104_1 /TAXON_ID=210618 ORGANISM="Striatella unipunctata, Strain CCMP2910" /NCGR_SAMPLE_ID=MMETSP0800 /ASSEMBLY_ACC=CAM_ASM_000638 /LENGTH=77 /DNA_ID=CAMNT_0006586065 /DNA_START=78 /DNA_END=311 /DNA_ORIENTATION=-